MSKEKVFLIEDPTYFANDHDWRIMDPEGPNGLAFVDADADALYDGKIVVLKRTRRKVKNVPQGAKEPVYYYYEIVTNDGEQPNTSD